MTVAKKKAVAVKASAVKKDKPAVKNSLVNNINARKKKGESRKKKNSTVSKASYSDMENNWGKKE